VIGESSKGKHLRAWVPSEKWMIFEAEYHQAGQKKTNVPLGESVGASFQKEERKRLQVPTTGRCPRRVMGLFGKSRDGAKWRQGPIKEKTQGGAKKDDIGKEVPQKKTLLPRTKKELDLGDSLTTG